ncbi:MAG TPA: undecaprenyl-phosphate glucose phosphotransferase [Microscillaceae bacterium]|nr:undecaprenyl-phosphate glucose phosphotransferase [Microscillaceae bacterium]
MTHQYSKFLHPIYLLGDLLLLNLAFILSYLLLFQRVDLFIFNPYFFLLVFFNIIWVFVSVLLDNHEKNRMASDFAITKKIARALLLHFAAIATILLFIKATYFSRLHLLYSYSIYGLLVLTWRLSFIQILRAYRKRGHNFRTFIIIGENKAGKSILNFINRHPEFGYKFLGFFDKNIAGIEEFAKNNQLDEVYVSLNNSNEEDIQQLTKVADRNLIRLKLISNINADESKFQKLAPAQYGNTTVLSVINEPLNNAFNQLVKRIFDITFSFFVLLLIHSWLIPLIAILIKRDSSGPIFFVQKRSGRNGKKFPCIKFRTMTYQKNAQFVQATKNDSRVTNVGKFLRKTNLDEFPQFINVLMGHMTVVGPRPHPIPLDDTYKENVEKYTVRHYVKPGITGLAQAKGYRGETREMAAMKNRIRFDVFYVQNWSLFLDIKIIFMTVFNMVRGEKNAY